MRGAVISCALMSGLSTLMLGCSVDRVEKSSMASKSIELVKRTPPRPTTVLANPLTAEQQAAIKDTLAPCWNFDPSLANAKTLIVNVRLYLKPDGSVFQTELVEPSSVKSSPEYQAAAVAALRAPMNPACSKFPLTSDREFSLIVSFDPKDMGQ